MHDYGEPPGWAALVVSTSASAADPRQFCGPAYACLGPAFWGLPRRQLRDSVDRVLIAIAASADLREDMSRRGQDAIDGYGALRVAFQIASLAARGEAVA